MALESLAVANEILTVANERSIRLTPLQLQKLTYFAHGWCLGLFDRPLINEQVEAWPYGPVIPSVYHEFKKYGDEPIKSRARHLVCTQDGDTALVLWSISESDDDELKTVANKIAKRIVDLYGHRSGVELSSITHKLGTPWRQISDLHPGGIPKGTDVPQELIKEYFKSISAD